MKKHLFIVLLLSLSLVTIAQNKKVAVMETKVSSGVTAFQSNVVRGAMESAVSKAKGFEGYDRGAFDMIMKEQEFQRSGAVDDSQIKKLGQMTGVQYILVTEASAQDGYFYILAKLLDVETGKYGQAYDDLCGASSPDIKSACAKIGESLFIIKKSKKSSSGVNKKKVAVMVPKAGDEVTEFQSNMVRGTMESAISKAKGFEGYDRGAFDMIMKEQEFQRSGAVDDSQIKQLGQMAGVQYILVTEIYTQDGYFSVNAKLLDVETGKYEQAYDEVCAKLPYDIRETCEEIGAIMFTGKRPSVTKKIKNTILPPSPQVPTYVEDRSEQTTVYYNDNSNYNQNYNNYNQNYNNYDQNYNNNYNQNNNNYNQNYNNYNQNNNNNYNQNYNNYNQNYNNQNYNNYNQNYQPYPTAPRSRVGDVKYFQDGSRGVVFYMENGKGLAVSIDESEMKWDNSRRHVDIPYLGNTDNDRKVFIYGLGKNNTMAIIQQCGGNAIAASWCLNHGVEWYLPSSGELYLLMMSAKKGTALYSKLESFGTQLSGWYWSSSEHNKDEALNVSDGGTIHAEDKDEDVKVRAIRAFTE